MATGPGLQELKDSVFNSDYGLLPPPPHIPPLFLFFNTIGLQSSIIPVYFDRFVHLLKYTGYERTGDLGVDGVSVACQLVVAL